MLYWFLPKQASSLGRYLTGGPPTAQSGKDEPTSIAELIACEGGRVTFARFMELALTQPTLGYYSRAKELLGPSGDFSTAPALSPFFCRTFAKLLTELVDSALEAGTVAPDQAAAVVELGGGEGQLTSAVLGYWDDERPQWRGRIAYRILEVGPALRRRQEEVLADAIQGGWQVRWGAHLAEACAGAVPVVMVGNEFLDALPVHLVDVREETPQEAYVETAATPAGAGMVESWGPLSLEARSEIASLFGQAGALIPEPASLVRLTTDGVLELRPAVGAFLEEAASLMPSGTLVFVDYGEWFRGVGPPLCCSSDCDTSLRRRTIRGYFKHRLTNDVLAWPGRQDLTADVDFAALDHHGQRRGFETIVFTTLSAFLRAGGAENELRRLMNAWPRTAEGPPGTRSQGLDPLESDRQATVLAALLDEQDLGRAFKVMVLVRE